METNITIVNNENDTPYYYNENKSYELENLGYEKTKYKNIFKKYLGNEETFSNNDYFIIEFYPKEVSKCLNNCSDFAFTKEEIMACSKMILNMK